MISWYYKKSSMLLYILSLSLVSSLKIMLNSGLGGKSHIKAFFELSRELIEYGHQIRYTALDDNINLSKGYDNITTVGLGYPGAYRDFYVIMTKDLEGKKGAEAQEIFWNLVYIGISYQYELEYIGLEKYLAEDRPDVFICDYYSFACIDLAEQYRIPLIVGIQAYDVSGLQLGSYMSASYNWGPSTRHTMSLWERIYDVLFQWKVHFYWKKLTATINRQRKKLSLPPKSHMAGSLHYGLGMVTSYMGFETANRLPPYIKLVGSIPAISDTKPHPVLEEFMRTHDKIVYAAFGSIVTLDPPLVEIISTALTRALDNHQIDGVVWGLGKTKRSSFPSQIIKDPRFLISDWAPQTSILNSPRVKLFISHGGIESCFESIRSSTPMLIHPILNDQARNARKIYDMGIGLHIDPTTVTSDSLYHQIHHILSDSQGTIHANLVRTSTLHQLQPDSARSVIESHTLLAQACRPHFPIPNPSGHPCELHHLHPQPTLASPFLMSIHPFDVYLTLLLLLSLPALLLILIFNRLNKLHNSPPPPPKSHAD